MVFYLSHSTAPVLHVGPILDAHVGPIPDAHVGPIPDVHVGQIHSLYMCLYYMCVQKPHLYLDVAFRILRKCDVSSYRQLELTEGSQTQFRMLLETRSIPSTTEC